MRAGSLTLNLLTSTTTGANPLLLAFDCSTAACTAALFASDGALIAGRDEVIGRGHAERLVPMIADLLGQRRPSSIVVGIGPGSFTGLRVAIAAAHGLAIGWGAGLLGMPSLALLAASAPGDEPVVAVMSGGHGELFVQSFDRDVFSATSEAMNLTPKDAAAVFPTGTPVGNGAAQLAHARGQVATADLLPTASAATRLPLSLRALSPAPLYVRVPDAIPRGMNDARRPSFVLERCEAHHLDEVMPIMAAAFSSDFGEGWTRSQCAGILPMAGISMFLARDFAGGSAQGFSLFRTVCDEAELLLIAVAPPAQRKGVGRALIDHFIASARACGAKRLHLEVRNGNRAIGLYQTAGFEIAGRRPNYYRGASGQYDALTLVLGSKVS